MVSAFAARQRLVLGQIKVADKSNEIIAIPKLLDMLAIEGAIVTIDAMGCQREIAQKIVDKKADYVLALKGNQGTLREDVELFVTEQKARNFTEAKVTRHRTVDGDHGRIETRTTTAIHDIAWLQQRHAWPALNGVVMVESIREMSGAGMGTPKVEHETRFYITSLVGSAQLLGPIVRSHWAVENSLHWVLDMTFRDDECRVRTQHAPANFITVKHMAHNLIRRARGKETRCVSGAKSPPGTTTSSQAYCSVDPFTRFPCGNLHDGRLLPLWRHPATTTSGTRCRSPGALRPINFKAAWRANIWLASLRHLAIRSHTILRIYLGLVRL